MRQGDRSFVRRLGKTLQRLDDITEEPLPRRWVELIHYLDELERKQSSRLQQEAELRDRGPQ